MKASRIAILVGVAVLVTWALGLTLAGQVRSSSMTIKGVWQVTEWSTSGLKGRVNQSPQPWYYVFTDRHYSVIGVNGDTPRPALPPPAKRTPRQLSDAFERFVAGFGTYGTTGRDTLIIGGSGTTSGEKTLLGKRLVSLHPNDMASSQTFTYILEGANTVWLTLTAEGAGPVANPTTFKLTRVE
jgi:hypothetical protein